MFVDRVRIWAIAGNGGDGCSSFLREKFVPKGGPNGGDGGNGGSIILRVNPHLNNLVHLKFQPHIFAEKGVKGMRQTKTGKSGQDRIVDVPPGTSVFHLPTTEDTFERAANDSNGELVADLVSEGQTFILSKGGRGGKGNVHYKSSTHQAPTYFQKGTPGGRGQYILELKSIADIGLVGFPNAGKSSLLGKISAAQPKVAPYPFTTLQPTVGVVEYPGYKRVTVADIPGLIEGAHEGVGLGHDFLRHIERCRVLAFVLDMAGSEARDPLDDYAQLRTEIKLYEAELSRRPHFVVANKIDLESAAENLARFKKRFRAKVIPISTLDGTGMDTLKREIHSRLRAEKPDPA